MGDQRLITRNESLPAAAKGRARRSRFVFALLAAAAVASWAVAWTRAPAPAATHESSVAAATQPADMPGALLCGSTATREAVAALEQTAGRREKVMRRLRQYAPERAGEVQLCQCLGPAAPCPVRGVDCAGCDRRLCGGWERARLIAWQAYAQGEYVGHDRLPHVPEYRLRVDDQIDLIYRVTRDETSTPYKLNVGDEVRVESFTDPDLNRDLVVQPDGTITVRLLGQVHATGRTIPQLRDSLEELYKKFYKVPAITVTPLKVNTKLEDLRATVDRRYGIGGQSQLVRVTPEGTISLTAIGSVCAQGLTIRELQAELNERYRQEIEGIEVVPVLLQRAPRYIYVLGEVKAPGRFELTGPTTAMQAIALAGSWNVGANLKQIVVFRRGDDWRLLATMINLEAALCGGQPCPPGEIWLSDSDVIVVPKGVILQATDFIDLVFRRGIYGVFPLNASINFAKHSTI
jgi:polysaccharide export outer membrane protein